MSNTDTLELLFAIGKAGMRAFAKKSRKRHVTHYRHYRRKAGHSKFANGPIALIMAAGALVATAFHSAPALLSSNPPVVATCAGVFCCQTGDLHELRGRVSSEARTEAKCRRSDVMITGCMPLSEAALKSLIDQAIVPAMVDRFLAEKG